MDPKNQKKSRVIQPTFLQEKDRISQPFRESEASNLKSRCDAQMFSKVEEQNSSPPNSCSFFLPKHNMQKLSESGHLPHKRLHPDQGDQEQEKNTRSSSFNTIFVPDEITSNILFQFQFARTSFLLIYISLVNFQNSGRTEDQTQQFPPSIRTDSSTSISTNFTLGLISTEENEEEKKLKLEYSLENQVQYVTAQTIVLTFFQNYLQIKKLTQIDSNDKLIIIDCRFEFEYDGGHIQGAINKSNPMEINNLLFTPPPHELKLIDQIDKKDLIIVFYCEFSEKRSVDIYRMIRNEDRNINEAFFPQLIYPNIFVLEKGFFNFFKKYQDCCDGQYIPMKEKTFKQERKNCSSKLKEQWKEIKKQKNPNKLKQSLELAVAECESFNLFQ